MPPRSRPEDATTACPACAPTTVQAITRPSSWIPTATGSRPIAINPPREPGLELKFCLGAQGDKLTAPRQNAARGSAGAGDATSAGRTPCQHDALFARRYRDGSPHAPRIGIGERLAAGDGGEFRRAFRRVRLPYPHFGDPEKFPFFAGRVYTPEQASPEEMAALHKAFTSSGGDRDAERLRHRQFSNALRHEGARRRARGVAVVDDKTPESELDAMNAAGIRGIRINLATGGINDPAVACQRLAGRHRSGRRRATGTCRSIRTSR